ncbi:hypothetical protein FRB97_002371 [Tulasnella sp. 331]|nr:hypothetical protein FRB97_002371 [Tulasnella sp. 331]
MSSEEALATGTTKIQPVINAGTVVSLEIHPKVSESTTSDDEKSTPEQDKPPFSVFTKREKWVLISITSYAGFLSAVAGSIYFPVIPTLATEFHTSPVSPFSASHSSGSASTIALAIGVVSDIAMPHERGTFLGVSVLGALTGPRPVLGGVFAGTLGWRPVITSITSSLLTYIGPTLQMDLLVHVYRIWGVLSRHTSVSHAWFLPETLRHIVGDGSILAPWWDRPLIPVIGPYRRRLHEDTKEESNQSSATSAGKQASTRMNPLRLLLQLDVVIMLFCSSLSFALFTAMQAVTSVIFQRTYTYLDETFIGLCYLPTGLGMMAGSFLTGRLLDRIYVKDRKAWMDSQAVDGAGDEKGAEKRRMDTLDERVKQELELSFRLEYVRLKSSVVYSLLLGAMALAFGWMVEQKVQLAGPLIMQFILGWCVIGQGNSLQTLLIDNFPKQGSSTTAMVNLFRCSLSAVLTSIINIILEAIGIGWTFTLLGGLFLVLAPTLILLIIRIGPRWRRRRMLARWEAESKM